MTSTNPAPEQGKTTADSPEDIAVRTGVPAELVANSVGEYVRIWVKQIRSGESGALPVIIGLIVIVIFFQIKNSAFLSAGNLVNLMTQAAFIITLGMAEVFVLLLGEIDLAAGFTAACGAVVALWMVATGWPWWVAVLVTLAATAAYGALQGFIITALRLPSFVVTLAGYLGLSGLLIYLIQATGRHRQRRCHPAEQQRHQRHRGRRAQRGRQLDRHDRAGGAGRGDLVPAGPPPAR